MDSVLEEIKKYVSRFAILAIFLIVAWAIIRIGATFYLASMFAGSTEGLDLNPHLREFIRYAFILPFSLMVAWSIKLHRPKQALLLVFLYFAVFHLAMFLIDIRGQISQTHEYYLPKAQPPVQSRVQNRPQSRPQYKAPAKDSLNDWEWEQREVKDTPHGYEVTLVPKKKPSQKVTEEDDAWTPDMEELKRELNKDKKIRR